MIFFHYLTPCHPYTFECDKRRVSDLYNEWDRRIHLDKSGLTKKTPQPRLTVSSS